MTAISVCVVRLSVVITSVVTVAVSVVVVIVDVGVNGRIRNVDSHVGNYRFTSVCCVVLLSRVLTLCQ